MNKGIFMIVGVAALVAACSSTVTEGMNGANGGAGDDASDDAGSNGSETTSDGGARDGGGGGDPSRTDGSTPTSSGTDGTATRAQCTTSFHGTALSGSFGRMDGYLVAIVPPNGSRSCRADSSHVHLQVKVDGVVYDVAVNTDTYVAEKDVALPDGAWSEGWHAGARLDYPTTLGLHASSFASTTQSAQAQTIENALASANHVSIFATPYDSTGAHDVHRKGGGDDGAIFVDPLSSPAHVLAFRFSTDSF